MVSGINTNKNKYLIFLWMLSIIPLIFYLFKFFGLALGSSFSLLLFFLIYIYIRFLNISKNSSFFKTDYINSFIFVSSLVIIFLNCFVFLLDIYNFKKIELLIFSVDLAIFTCFLYLFFLSYVRTRFRKKENLNENYISFSISVIILLFVLFVDRPFEIFLGNVDEFTFSFWDLLYSMLFYISIGLIASLIICLINYRILTFFDSIISSIIIASYVQLLFFNKYVGNIMGGMYQWKTHIIYTLINTIIWIAIFGFILFISFKYKKIKNILLFIKAFVFALLLVSLIYLVFTSSSDSFKRRQFYIEGQERYTVGKGDNTIIFIMDAVDNSYIKEIYSNNPELFNEFNDFTLYMNTCSIYDMSTPSIPSMIWGYRGDIDVYNDIPFVNRYRNNDYRLLNYSWDANRYGCFDNYVSSEDTKEMLSVRYNAIREGFIKLSFYSIFPCIIKNQIKTNNIDFSHCVLYGDYINSITTDNTEYYNELNLRYNEKSDNCFIVEHLNGAHFYVDDYIEETKLCLRIYEKYILQLKELGVYDNSTLIFCADHGVHDGVDPNYPYPTAATPMFMVKKKNEHHDNMNISNVPVYYTDFQSTVLKASDLFIEESDYSTFGNSIYEYDEDTERKRTWFKTPKIADENYRKYTFYGDTHELERVVEEGVFTETGDYKLDNTDFN